MNGRQPRRIFLWEMREGEVVWQVWTDIASDVCLADGEAATGGEALDQALQFVQRHGHMRIARAVIALYEPADQGEVAT